MNTCIAFYPAKDFSGKVTLTIVGVLKVFDSGVSSFYMLLLPVIKRCVVLQEDMVKKYHFFTHNEQGSIVVRAHAFLAEGLRFELDLMP